MKIEESRIANRHALEQVASYLSVENQVLQELYDELLLDRQFLQGVNSQIIHYAENKLFTKGLFGKGAVDNVDWFGFQRVLIYVLIRLFKPKYCLETGVYYGGNTAFMLNALHKNNSGTLISIDYPDSQIREEESSGTRHPWVEESEFYSPTIQPGFMVPEYLRAHWELKIGSSLDLIPPLTQEFQFYIHDSDHAYQFLLDEVTHALKKLNTNALMIIDDIDWSNAFFQLCSSHQWYPLLVPDNGKGGVRARTGMIKLDHKFCNKSGITCP
jgi:hypothetical protein